MLRGKCGRQNLRMQLREAEETVRVQFSVIHQLQARATEAERQEAGWRELAAKSREHAVRQVQCKMLCSPFLVTHCFAPRCKAAEALRQRDEIEARSRQLVDRLRRFLQAFHVASPR